MNMVQKIGDIENHIGDLDTAIRALHRLADDMTDGGHDDTWAIVRMVANHLEDIHRKMNGVFQEACKRERSGPRAVSG